MPKMAIRAPAIGLGQLDGDYDQFTTEALQDVAPPFYAAASEKATKITYYTPRLLGLQVGAVPIHLPCLDGAARGTCLAI